MRALRLRPLGPDDEAAFRSALEAMTADDFTFGFDYTPDLPWGSYLKMLDERRRGLNVPDGWVPDTFLVADVGGTIVGRASIRHELNESLERNGGHIGYCVLPGSRRRGYATEILRQSLVVARAVGIDRALLFCDDDNLGSAAVIERCGGKPDAVTGLAPASARSTTSGSSRASRAAKSPSREAARNAPLPRRQRVQHDQQRDADRVGQQGLLLRVVVVRGHHQVGDAHVEGILAAGGPGAQQVQADPGEPSIR